MAIQTGVGRHYRVANDRRYGINVIGARELRRQFKLLGLDAKDMKKPHRELVDMVKPVAMTLVPPTAPSKDKRGRTPTGRLQATIGGMATKTFAELRAGRGGQVVYAGVQEYGWPAKNIPAKHYLNGAIAKTRGQVKNVYEMWIDERIRVRLAITAIGQSMNPR